MSALRVILSFGLLACLSSTTAAQYYQPGPPWNPETTPFGIVGDRPLPCAHKGSAFLGIELEDAAGWGVLVLRVVAGSASDKAAVEVGDQIIGLDGRVTETLSELRSVLGKHAPGDSVQLVFRREEALHVTDLVLGSRPAVRNQDRLRSPALDRVVEFLGVQPGQVVADIGCGSGWLAVRIAALTGSTGKVFGVEINTQQFLSLKEHKVDNLAWVYSKPGDISLKENVLDLAVLHDVASHVSKAVRVDFYASIARSLKANGKLIVFGPHGRAEEMLCELELYGFVAEKVEELAGLSKSALDQRLRAGIRFIYKPK